MCGCYFDDNFCLCGCAHSTPFDLLNQGRRHAVPCPTVGVLPLLCAFPDTARRIGRVFCQFQIIKYHIGIKKSSVTLRARYGPCPAQ